MNVEVTHQFNKDISKLRDKKLILALRAALEQIEAARSLSEIPNLKKMEGTSHYFRMRVGDYRIGVLLQPKPDLRGKVSSPERNLQIFSIVQAW